jgi:hypothetical protein
LAHRGKGRERGKDRQITIAKTPDIVTYQGPRKPENDLLLLNAIALNIWADCVGYIQQGLLIWLDDQVNSANPLAIHGLSASTPTISPGFFSSYAPQGSAAIYPLYEFLTDTFEREGMEGIISRERIANPRCLDRIKSWLRELVRRISLGNWEILRQMHLVAHDHVIVANTMWCHSITRAVQIALGGRDLFLFGIRGGRPAYKPLGRPLLSALDIQVLNTRIPFDLDPQCLGIGDEELIPRLLTDGCAYGASGIEGDTAKKYSWPEGATYEMVFSLLKEAYYNQYYLIHPQGCHLKIGGLPGISEAVLKVMPSVRDPNFFDIQARYIGEDGDYVVAVGTNIVDLQEKGLREPEHIFMILTTVQLYHDLVTVQHIGKGEGMRGNAGIRKKQHRPDQEVWRLIPRIIQNIDQEKPPRIAIDNPRSRKPHFVSGHPRKGNMSEEQRAFIIQFEQDTGLSVLKWLRPGETWVRPHTSPSGSESEIKHLPRFVRNDMEKVLKDRIASIRIKDSPLQSSGSSTNETMQPHMPVPIAGPIRNSGAFDILRRLLNSR